MFMNANVDTDTGNCKVNDKIFIDFCFYSPFVKAILEGNATVFCRLMTKLVRLIRIK